MPIDETVRKYQTGGKPVTQKIDTKDYPNKEIPNSVSIQFNDTVKKELSHGDCPGCMY